MCRPPCVALSFGISGRREEGYSWSFLQTSFENGRNKRPCVTSFPPTRDSKKGGLHMVVYTWSFFPQFLKDVCSKTMCRPPCVALPFGTFRRMSTEKTMCSPLPFDQRREGYTWCATHGLFFLPFLKDVCSKTMCRPPCVALPFVKSLFGGKGATSFENQN